MPEQVTKCPVCKKYASCNNTTICMNIKKNRREARAKKLPRMTISNEPRGDVDFH
jgi:hypothetical protein